MAEPTENKGQVVVAQGTESYKSAALLPATVQALHDRPAVYTTLDMSKAANKAALYDMVVSGGDNAKEWINRHFSIEHIAVHPVVVTNKETGEVAALPRIIILTPDGNAIQFVSQGIWGCLTLMRDCGFQPFGPTPQQWELKSIDLGGGRQLYKLLRYVAPKQEKSK